MTCDIIKTVLYSILQLDMTIILMDIFFGSTFQNRIIHEPALADSV